MRFFKFIGLRFANFLHEIWAPSHSFQKGRDEVLGNISKLFDVDGKDFISQRFTKDINPLLCVGMWWVFLTFFNLTSPGNRRQFDSTCTALDPPSVWSSSKSKSLCIDCPFRELKSPPPWLQLQLAITIVLNTATASSSYIRSRGNSLFNLWNHVIDNRSLIRKYDLIRKASE